MYFKLVNRLKKVVKIIKTIMLCTLVAFQYFSLWFSEETHFTYKIIRHYLTYHSILYIYFIFLCDLNFFYYRNSFEDVREICGVDCRYCRCSRWQCLRSTTLLQRSIQWYRMSTNSLLGSPILQTTTIQWYEALNLCNSTIINKPINLLNNYVIDIYAWYEFFFMNIYIYGLYWN
jgi:hypothetical protein